MSYHRRQDAIAKLGTNLVADVKEVKAVDAEERGVRVVWDDGAIGRVAIEDGGEIQKVIVLDEVGQRRRQVEWKMMKAGRIEILAAAL